MDAFHKQDLFKEEFPSQGFCAKFTLKGTLVTLTSEQGNLCRDVVIYQSIKLRKTILFSPS